MNSHSTENASVLPTDEIVRQRYSAAANRLEQQLCCPIDYDPKFLEVIPREIIERDYGCGDPTRYVRPGDTVLDLGSGGGKLCFIISQQVGAAGRVIGVDVNADMLALARAHQADVSRKIGYHNIDFKRARIQDLAVDLDQLALAMESVNLQGPEGALNLVRLPEQLREQRPMIADHSVDCVVSNCVFNLVKPSDRRQLFAEVFRVLKPGGRAAISDIVADEDVPLAMRADAELWSGCIAGAWREDRFIDEFVAIGFQGVQVDKWQSPPWQTVGGIEFRSLTVLAYKPFSQICLERKQAVIYRGPFSQVSDDDGHTYRRGQRTAVCDRTFRLLSEQSFANSMILIEPTNEIPVATASLFDCSRDQFRSPREPRSGEDHLTQLGGAGCCDDVEGCC